MLILGIESSCDETACAIVENGVTVRSSIVSSQIDLHKVYGGVIPEIAARAHLECFPAVMEECISAAGLSSAEEISAIGVTQGPGLMGALLVGISYAKGLAYGNNLPLVPVDHIHAHIYGALLEQVKEDEFSEDAEFFPALALVVSGGHTNLFLLQSRLSFELIASSRDDACGECFDKVAKMMGLEYPGGPKIEELAIKGSTEAFEMPRVRITTGLETGRIAAFSYSGLKTHLVNLVRGRNEEWWKENRSHIAASFQNEAFAQIAWVVNRALEMHLDIKNILVAGGVAANQSFRETMSRLPRSHKIHWPKLRYCSDNAAMIAGLAYYQFIDDPEKFGAEKPWEAYARYQQGCQSVKRS